MHSLTGCGSTSAFVGRGKKVAFDLLLSSVSYCDTMTELGKEFVVSDDLQAKCEEFICAVYGHCLCSDVNELRYIQFCSQQSGASHLPPTRNARRKHVLRANYQAAICRRALEGMPCVPSPHNQGWLVESGAITIDWTDQRPAPDELLEMTHCGCRTGWKTARGSCKKALCNAPTHVLARRAQTRGKLKRSQSQSQTVCKTAVKTVRTVTI